jgi:hypothetical protein
VNIVMDASPIDLNKEQWLSEIGIDSPETFREFITETHAESIADCAQANAQNGIMNIPIRELVAFRLRLMLAYPGTISENATWSADRGVWDSCRAALRKASRARFRFAHYIFSYTMTLTTTSGNLNDGSLGAAGLHRLPDSAEAISAPPSGHGQ